MDVILAFPQIMLALVVIATVGPKQWLIVLAVGLTTMPRVARVVRGAALTVVERDFVRAAEALGESTHADPVRRGAPERHQPAARRGEPAPDLLDRPHRRRSASSASRPQPPAADWGLMINENRQGLTVQPWGVVRRSIAIALLTIGTA